MDPVTGLSRRQLLALAALIPLGVAASTVATFVTERVQAACPDQVYGCATMEAGEPAVMALLVASDGSAARAFHQAQVVGLRGLLLGGPFRTSFTEVGCSPEDAAERVRELASDPPDEPPAAVVVAAACDEAAIPAAQILGDSGITLITLDDVRPVPTSPAFHLTAEDYLTHLEAADLIGAVEETVFGAMERVGIRDGDRLLIPRTPLREELIAEGFSPA